MDQIDTSKSNRGANPKACELFGKSLNQIEGYRGGQIFNCIHSFSLGGCGKDKNCESCKIKEAVVGTFDSGKPYAAVQEVLDIKNHNETSPYNIQVSTEKHGDFAIVTIDKYSKKA